MKSRQTGEGLFEAARGLLEARADAFNDEAGEHPNAGDLAAFFYGTSPKKGVSAHVAACGSCAAELALYAQAERAASAYKPDQKTAAEVPAAALRMIKDWEESDFAKPKATGDAPSADHLNKLAQLVATRRDISRARQSVTKREPNLVPVVVISRTGEFRGVEAFERGSNKRGETTLAHAERSERFDNIEIYALLYRDIEVYDVESYRVERGKARVGGISDQAADFFIVEE